MAPGGDREDDGSADPALRTALEDASTPAEVVAALSGARVLVPVLAVAEGSATQMAVVTVQGKDGRRALPAFTGLDSLMRWHADARPVPVAAREAALAGLEEGAEALLVDPAGPVRRVVQGAALHALADGRPLIAPHDDPALHDAVRRAVADDPRIAHVAVVAAVEADLSLLLSPAPGADAAAAARDLAERLRDDPQVRARLERGLEVVLAETRS
jgi:type III secretion system (T3SS) SseB-like protein